MTEDAYETYVDGVDPVARAVVQALHEAITAAAPELEPKIRYRMLMYGLDGDWHTFVCAIDAGRKHVCLRFLYGVLLDDPKSVLRPGSSVLSNWDIPFDSDVDVAGVQAYVREAVRWKPEYVENRDAVQAASHRDAERAGRRPKQ